MPKSATPKRPADELAAPKRAASRASAPKGAAKKVAAPRSAAKGAASARAAARTEGTDPAVEDYFATQAPDKRLLLEQLRALVADGVPDTQVSIKWGVPFYQRNGKNVCALAAFKEHVAINFFAPPERLVDPDGQLEGSGQSNRMLKMRSDADIDAPSIERWLTAAVVASG